MSSSYDNNGQYSRHSILRYEKIFGRGFVSSGGAEVTHSFCDRLELKPGARILDIGSGLGGAAFYMADKFGAEVLGVDLSPVMIDIANERVAGQNEKVEFKLGDVREMPIEEGSLDLIWSRDSLLHVPEKKELFAQLYRWLKPGGQVMISDYSQSPAPKTQEFKDYVVKSGYHLLDVETYGNLFKEAGFLEVIVEDWTEWFIEILRQEQQNLQDNREVFLKDFTQEDLDYLHVRWEQKVGYCLEGDMHVGLWRARRIN